VIIDYLDPHAAGDYRADLCIVGGGPAGIAIALAFADSPFTVCLIEGGGVSGEDRSQSLYEGESAGDLPLDAGMSRMRVLGGSCTLWGGGCIPFSDDDLVPRDWVPDSGWPLRYADLAPWYDKAREFCRINATQRPGHFDGSPPRAPLDLDPEALVNFVFARSPITFGDAYREALRRSANVTVLLHANVMELDATADAATVTGARIGSLDGRRGYVRARHYVLAAGGIENARIMLLSDSVAPAGLGNDRDLVGRYFMEHVTAPGDVAAIALADETRIPYYYVHTPDVDQASMRAILMPSDAYLKRSNGLSISLSLYAAHKPGAEPTADAKQLEPAVVGMLRSLGGTAETSGMIYGVACALEPVPSAANRVTLTAERDALGLPKLKLTWRPTRVERDSLTGNLDAVARAFGAWGGAVKVLLPEGTDWFDDEIGWGNHHMGTTRMADDPKQGVVDADSKVHGLGNLYVAGSSVFPTYGASNPTLNLIALTLRLADHLKTVAL